jgi:hypothetical protein
MLVGVAICYSFAGDKGSEIGKSDATGMYKAQVPLTEGHQELVGVWPVKAGYWFTPAYLLFEQSTGGERIATNFVARLGHETPATDECRSPPFIK